MPNNLTVTSPLTDLSEKEASDPVQWMKPGQQAFIQLSASLCDGPLLLYTHSPL